MMEELINKTEAKFWEEKGKLDKKIVAGGRLPQKHFQSKRKVDIPANKSHIFDILQKRVTENNYSFKKSSDMRTRLLHQKEKRELGWYKAKNNSKLPALRESISNPLLQSIKAYPYKNEKDSRKLNSSVIKHKMNANNHVHFNYSVDSPYIGPEMRMKRELRQNGVYKQI